MKRTGLIAVLSLTLPAAISAGEKTVRLPEMIQEMKEQEQADGLFRAKISESGELRALLLTGGFAKPEHFRALAGVATLESLSTGCIQKASVQEMTNLLPSLGRLKMLSVTSPEPQAWNLAFFKTVSGLREIRQLRLSYASIPVGALHLLGNLPNLEVLELPSAQLNVQDLRELQRCPKLVELNLRGARVDNSALPILLGLKSLKFLDLGRYDFGWAANTLLSAKGVTVRPLLDHRDLPESPWRPWME